nr:major facilitator protein [Kwoniella bestiolae CBS 10118]OCF28988.1 major facilitator protein [Kwoniella bestiolae CBS 10118]
MLCWQVNAFRVPISDTDSLREVCSGMYGGKDAYIQVTFDPTSSGQVALIVYEWRDVPYLGVGTPDSTAGGDEEGPKTYICTTSAIRSGLCQPSQLGGFITSLPEGVTQDSTSIFTTPLKFSSSSFPSPTEDEDDISDEFPSTTSSSHVIASETATSAVGDGETEAEAEAEAEAEELEEAIGDGWKRQLGDDILDGVAGSVETSTSSSDDDLGVGDGSTFEDTPTTGSSGSSSSSEVPIYSAPITYTVPKTGYYCVGIVPVTLVNARSDIALESRQSPSHAEYSGLVLFKNTFEGELPAVEYPKINFYMALSFVYFVLGCGWAYLCVQHLKELLPMQYYISGTIVFLVIEMLAQFAYYRYINKHGGGTTSIVFLFVIAIFNAARNSLSFFLLLIVSMGLSVVTQSLGSVMTRVRILTALHFIFGVMYSVGTVEVQLDSASLITVMLLIFPLSLTLTAFLMWIIVSLNGTIMHLQARKQRYKLQMFQRLWRILIISVIAVAAFFVVSSMSLSNRLDEDYAPNNWKYRWILLDGSLSTIYLCAFASIAWLWRPTRDNIQFSMSQELAQDEADADAEDYEIDSLEAGRSIGMDGHRLLRQNDDEDDEHRGLAEGRDGNVVFAMGEDSDEEDGAGDSHGHRKQDGYRDSEENDEEDRKGKHD